MKKSAESRNREMSDEREFRIADLENKCNEAVKKERETRAKAIEML